MACKSLMVSGYMSNDGHCLPELGGGGQYYLSKRMNKIEHEGLGTCARIEISQDADNVNQKVKVVSESS